MDSSIIVGNIWDNQSTQLKKIHNKSLVDILVNVSLIYIFNFSEVWEPYVLNVVRDLITPDIRHRRGGEKKSGENTDLRHQIATYHVHCNTYRLLTQLKNDAIIILSDDSAN